MGHEIDERLIDNKMFSNPKYNYEFDMIMFEASRGIEPRLRTSKARVMLTIIR